MVKKILIIILFILDLSFFSIKTNKAFIEKINIELKKDEMGITFLINNDNNSLLLSKNNEHNLFILKHQSDDGIMNKLKLFGVNQLNNIFALNKFDTNYKLDSLDSIAYLDILKKNNITKMRIDTFNFCIYEQGYNKNFNECDFLYVLDNDNLAIDEDIKVVFYTEKVNIDNLNIYEKWIDSYKIDDESYITLVIKDDHYDFTIIPIKN